MMAVRMVNWLVKKICGHVCKALCRTTGRRGLGSTSDNEGRGLVHTTLSLKQGNTNLCGQRSNLAVREDL